MAETAWQPRDGRGVIPLRPLSIAEIIDAPFAAIRRYLGAMLGISLALAIVIQAVGLGWELGLRNSVVDASGVDAAAFVDIILYLVLVVVSLPIVGWQTALAAEAVLGRDVTAAQVWQRVRPRIGRLIGAALLSAVPFGLWMLSVALAAWTEGAFAVLAIVLFFPALWLSIVALFLTPVVVLEGSTVLGAVRRSIALMRGSWWRVLGVLTLMTLITAGVALAVALPFLPGPLSFLTGGLIGDDELVLLVSESVGSTLATTIFTPLLAAVVAVLYLDVRIRTEAFDLTVRGAVPGSSPTEAIR